jgi:1L-myo-inositol 1-phosphate cytidylyltransferase / CDP-L-myo-inositol myo-inositolphosphotransferase
MSLRTQRAPHDPFLTPPRVAVVLAAGRSERLAQVTGGGSKALIRLAGVSLVERAVRATLATGIEKVIVVVGFHAGPVAAVVRSIKGLPPGSVHIVLAKDWDSGNGASLAASAEHLQDEALFAVMTADHVFGEGALAPICRSDQPAVLVDPQPTHEVWSEGTRVRTQDGEALAFAKDLPDAAVDCGVFVLSPEVFECQRQASRHGDASLAGAVTRYAEQKPIRTVCMPSGSWWQDVDTPADLARCKRLLRRSLAKADDGPVSRYLNRPVSTRLSMWIAPARLSPDLLSWLSAVLGIAAAVILGMGSGLAGGLLAHATSVVDGMDGEAARLQLRASPPGALLDGTLDRIADAAIVAGLTIWSFTATTAPSTMVIVLGVAATFGWMMSMASKDRITAHGLPPANERALGWLLGGRDGRLFLVTVFAILGLPWIAVVTTAVTAAITLTFRVIIVRRLAL